jgi:hypothetical protein
MFTLMIITLTKMLLLLLELSVTVHYLLSFFSFSFFPLFFPPGFACYILIIFVIPT